jgi:putative ATP-binding cassette transporter
MQLLRFLTRETAATPRGAMMAMTLLSGLATGGLLALVNLGAELATSQNLARTLLALTFLALLGVVLGARAFALNHLVVTLEQAILSLRLRLTERLCRHHPPLLARQLQAGALTPLTRDIGILSQSILSLAPVAESLLILAAMLAYLAWLSLASLTTVLAMGALALPVAGRLLAHSSTRLRGLDGDDGLPLFLEQLRRADGASGAEAATAGEFARFCEQVEQTRRVQIGAQIDQTWLFIGSRGLFYAMLLMLVFVLPFLVPEASATVHKVTGAVLFMIAPLHHLVESMPVLSQVNAALTRLYALEDALADGFEDALADVPAKPRPEAVT